MNFIKKLYRRKTLTILDDTQNQPNDSIKSRPSSSGLKRSTGFLHNDAYDSSETRLFEVSTEL